MAGFIKLFEGIKSLLGMYTEYEHVIYLTIFIVTSIICFAAPVALYFGSLAADRRNPGRRARGGIGTPLMFTVFIGLAVLFVRFAISYNTHIVEGGAMRLGILEEFADCLFQTLRTFGMEVEYSEYIVSVKAVISYILPESNLLLGGLRTVLAIYASMLTFAAPVAGGAAILGFLSAVFPKLRLRLAYMLFWRKKYFFSKLNETSLAMAKSIATVKRSEKPILIFTDTYVDKEDEKESELYMEAKMYGAICVRDDLVHVIKPGIFSKCEYYLMDMDELGNMQALMGLVEDHNLAYIKKSSIYIFVQSDVHVQIEKRINTRLKEAVKRGLILEADIPVIIPINGYRNLVQRLFRDVPLYEPLINKKDGTRLCITILGNGAIGTEAFLSAYWFGRMLVGSGSKVDECSLTINVVSKDSEDEFWSKIDYVNPEIKGSVSVVGSSEGSKDGKESESSKGPDAELLRADGSGTVNPPYCSVRYIQSDVKIGGFWSSNESCSGYLCKTDYFIVALGNDADNISIAENLRRFVGKRNIEAKSDDDVSNVIIAYAVFDSRLAASLNEHSGYLSRNPSKVDIYMHSFGDLDQVYSCDNVYMTKSALLAEGTGAVYRKMQGLDNASDNRDRANGNEEGNYQYWANLARAMHIKYKAFSVGLIKKSLFDFLPNSVDEYTKYVRACCDMYKRISHVRGDKDVTDDIREGYNEAERRRELLAWTEHRRWVAFTRTMGYRYTAEYARILSVNGKTHKNMEMKLHPCIIEARKPSVKENTPYLSSRIAGAFPRFEDSTSKEELEKYNTEQKLSYLYKKMAYLENKLCLIEKADGDDLDCLDKLSCSWGILATKESINHVKNAISALESGNDIQLASVHEISCRPFKNFDYYNYEFPEEEKNVHTEADRHK